MIRSERNVYWEATYNCRGRRGSLGRGRSRGAAAAAAAGAGAASVQGRARNHVGRLSLSRVAVDVNVDTGVAVAVCTREFDELGRSGSETPATGDRDLRAFGIELGRHGVEGDRLEADEVVAGGDRGGDRGRPGAVLSNHLTGAPSAVVDGSGKETGFVDLEL